MTVDALFVDPDTGLPLDELPVADAVARTDLGRRYGTGVTKADGGLLTSTTQYAPTLGKTMRLKWIIAIPSSDNTSANYLDIRWNGAAKPLYCGYALAHWEPFDAPAPDTKLDVTLSNSQPVAVTIHYEEL